MTPKQLEKREKMVTDGFIKDGIEIVNNKVTLPYNPSLYGGNGAGIAYIKGGKLYAVHFGKEQPPSAKSLRGYRTIYVQISNFVVSGFYA